MNSAVNLSDVYEGLVGLGLFTHMSPLPRLTPSTESLISVI